MGVNPHMAMETKISLNITTLDVGDYLKQMLFLLTGIFSFQVSSNAHYDSLFYK